MYTNSAVCVFQGDLVTSAGSDRTAGRGTENVRVTEKHRRLGGERYLAKLQ